MDFQHAKEVFGQYISSYDLKNDKIRLKVRHTYGVISCAEYLAEHMKLEKTDAELAQMIALLHDIGRFEQLRRFNSFDDRKMAHALCSLDVLFEQGWIEKFIPETREFDSIIYTAIKNHGVYKIEEPLEGRTKLQSLLIRDADKLDNYYVKETEAIETMLDVSAKEAGKEVITDCIYDCIMADQPVLNSDRVTHLDMWVSYVGYIYDLNFAESCQYLLERDCIPKIIKRISYEKEETRLRMAAIEASAQRYLKSRAGKNDEKYD